MGSAWWRRWQVNKVKKKRHELSKVSALVCLLYNATTVLTHELSMVTVLVSLRYKGTTNRRFQNLWNLVAKQRIFKNKQKF